MTKKHLAMPVSPLSPNPELQAASVVILHSSLAPAFERFCQENRGPLPLLGRSEPGKWTWPTLGTGPDTR